MTRILIADDHEVVRSGLRLILEAHPGWEVVAEAADGKAAIVKALEFKPDVAILDYSIPLVNGVEATRQIRKRNPQIEVLIFTMHDSETLVGEVLDAGARAYLLKSDAKEHLISAIEALAVHKPFFSGQVSEKLLETYLTLDATLTSFDPGAYKLQYVLHDRAGGKDTTFEVPITLTGDTASSAPAASSNAPASSSSAQ